jgi:hypothetical protein
MADLDTHELSEDVGDSIVETVDPRDAAEGSLLDDLVQAREALDARQTEDFALPGFEGKLWATCRLPKTRSHWHLVKRLADDDTPDAQLTSASAELIAGCTVGLWMLGPAGREDFAGFDAENPAGYEDLPERLVPPRPGKREHSPASRVLSLFNQRGGMVLGHAAEIAGWAQEGRRRGAEDASGESVGDRS